MACVSTAMVVGGGIAGLSEAVALARIGVHCDVVEMADAPVGASLGISGRAAEALAELGVYDECYKTGSPWTPKSTAASTMDAAGNLISGPPRRPQWPGAKTAIGVYRPVLLDILGDTALKLGVTVRRGLSTSTIQDEGDAALVTLSDGSQRRYDLVVGADGIGSRTRAALFPEAPKPAYSGQMSIRWMAPGPAVEGEAWYVGPLGRVGFYYLPQGMVYVAAVITDQERKRRTDGEVLELFTQLLDSYTAPAMVELRSRLKPGADLVCRPFDWIFVPDRWYHGRTILIGDAAHATTAHMGMGGGMALEDSVVLAQCVAAASTIEEAFQSFMDRRLERARTVVETSVALSRLEQAKAPRSENIALMSTAFAAISQPY